MTVAPYVLAVWLLLVGLYGVVTSRNLIHLTICLTVCQSASYVFLLAVGYRTGGTAPIFKGIPLGKRAVDPVVQALTLTDVVVSVTVLGLLLALALKAHERNGTLDPQDLSEVHG
ncbi:MAG: multicomponent Na+:H+ antiporter subunit [Gaiellaceae bacterium]|nr:multicomponent Na+:H+ antiporter subunit [Gaiellaceae bacterium]